MNGILKEIKGWKPIDRAYFIAMLLLVCSIVLNNAMNSISIMLLLAVWLIERDFARKWKQLLREPFFILNALLFGFYIIGIFMSADKKSAQFFLTKDLSLLLIPIVLLSGKRFSTAQIYLLLKAFILCVLLQMSVETLLSAIKYLHSHDRNVFIYHQLVSNINIGGAIVASFFCLLSVAFLFFLPDKGWMKSLLLALFSIWIVLLDSKLFLVVLLVLFLINIWYRLSRKMKLISWSAITLLVVILACTQNPVKHRFMDMNHFQASFLTADKFNKGMYFDGLSLRLVYIRFGFQILHENGNYLLGTGSGDAENLLKKKIVAYDMYTGNGTTEKEGYLKYGYHNEYLQKLIQFGFAGFAVFLAGIVYCFYMAIKYKNKLLLNLLIILNFSFLTDTLLEHQIGLVSYLVFTCLCIGVIRSKQCQTSDARLESEKK